MSNAAQSSLKTATTLVATGYAEPADPSWTKTIVAKAKTTSEDEKEKLKQLNLQMRDYLEDVRRLEDQNLKLIQEVDLAKASALPKIVNKIQFDKQLEYLRNELDNATLDNYKCQLRINDAENSKKYYNERTKFFQLETELLRKKISSLEARNYEIVNQKNFLVDGAKVAREDIERERQRQEKSEAELENLRKKLSSERLSSKKIEFETQSILEEIEFRKELFIEEANFLRNTNAIFLNANELAGFYKTELHAAIRQIKDDFDMLSRQQLQDYKDLKEQELAYVRQAAEKDRVFAEQSRQKLDNNKDLEIQTSRDLRASTDDNRNELGRLTATQKQLQKRLSDLEKQLEAKRSDNAYKLDNLLSEIRQLRDLNQTYKNELEQWERVTRTKLESEIQTYKSLLNSQLRMFDPSNENQGRPQPQPLPVSPGTQSGRPQPQPLPVNPGSQYGRPEPAIFQEYPSGGRSEPQINNNGRPQPQTFQEVNTGGRANPSTPKQPSIRVAETVVGRNQYSVDAAISVLKEVFDYFDRDRNGRINSSELDRVLSRLSIKLTKEAYDEILKEGDFDMSRDLDFNEFLKIMLPVFTGKFEDDELWYAFKKFDSDNSGKLTVSELKQILSKIGQHYSDRQLASLIATVDTDFDGKLNFKEFSRLLQSPAFSI